MNTYIHIPAGLDARYSKPNFDIDYVNPLLLVDSTNVDKARIEFEAVEQVRTKKKTELSNEVRNLKELLQTFETLKSDLGHALNKTDITIPSSIKHLIVDSQTITYRTVDEINAEMANVKNKIDFTTNLIESLQSEINSQNENYNNVRINFLIEENKYLKNALSHPVRSKSGTEVFDDYIYSVFKSTHEP